MFESSEREWGGGRGEGGVLWTQIIPTINTRIEQRGGPGLFLVNMRIRVCGGDLSRGGVLPWGKSFFALVLVIARSIREVGMEEVWMDGRAV